jgi:hypothetical protein
MVLTRGFRPEYHQPVLELHRRQQNCTAYGKFGTKYNTGTAQGSGVPDTADFNSLLNAFGAFVALRRTCNVHTGEFYTPEEAYNKLGVYGGDDGFTADIDPHVYERAIADIGQSLTAEVVSRGESGVKFLSRVYSPEVWFGCADSVCDVPRQLSKLHVTVHLPPNVTPVMKLVEKARALFLSDKNTPYVGEFVSRVVEMAGALPSTDNLGIWNAEIAPEVHYPNEKGDWMIAYINEAMPSQAYFLFLEFLKSAKTVSDLLLPPLLVEPAPAKSEVPVVVDGDVVCTGSKAPLLVVENKSAPSTVITTAQKPGLKKRDRKRPKAVGAKAPVRS